ncbi:LLM class flavin-dependent oxidoreductase [Pseudomonas aeruginosa]|nr:LLM class flavin-dependent oxidoreductase [Pseudomonas aeruginosa]
MQAGASESGRDFAASVADLVFAPTPDKEAALELRRDLSRRAERHGRSPRDVRLLPGFSLYLAESREEARKSSCRPTRAWTARASSPRSGRCSASTSATGRWTGRFPRPTCRRRWPTPAAAPTPTCCGA